MEHIKIEQGHLDIIKEIQTSYQELSIKLGQLALEQKILDAKGVKLDQEFNLISDNEMELLLVIRSKYGDGTLDLAAGTFIPNN